MGLLEWKLRSVALLGAVLPECRSLSVGIDLGTSNSAAVASLRGADDWRAIRLSEDGGLNLASVVYAQRDGSVRFEGPEGTAVRAWKRAVGLEASCVSWRLSKREAKALGLDDGRRSANRHVSMTTVVDGALVAVSPATCSSALLAHILDVSARELGEPVDRAVVGVPATYLPAQRESLEAAAREAGLDKVQLASEPELAAHAYGLGLSRSAPESLALVVDLGGGTLDVSFVAVGGATRTMEVIATSGDSCLGGVDFTKALAAVLRDKLETTRPDDDALFAAAERAKIDLSARPETTALGCVLTRDDLDAACAPLLKRLATVVREAALLAKVSLAGDVLRAVPRTARGPARKAREHQRRTLDTLRAGLDPGDTLAFWPENDRKVDDLVLVGAATRMPAVSSLLATLTGATLRPDAVDPELAVAVGAAIRASINDNLFRDDLLVFNAYQAEVLRHFAKKKQELHQKQHQQPAVHRSGDDPA